MNKKNKIAFIGTHGVGKTVLAYELTSELKKSDLNAILVPEILGICPIDRAPSCKGAEFDKEIVKWAQSWILHTQIAEEIRCQTQYPQVVCDRSVLDNYAYYIHVAGRKPLLDNLIKEWMKTYDYIFRVPINKKYLTVDSAKDLSHEYQQKIDRIIKELLEEFGVQYYNLPLEENIEFIKRVINLKQEKQSKLVEEGQEVLENN